MLHCEYCRVSSHGFRRTYNIKQYPLERYLPGVRYRGRDLTKGDGWSTRIKVHRMKTNIFYDIFKWSYSTGKWQSRNFFLNFNAIMFLRHVQHIHDSIERDFSIRRACFNYINNTCHSLARRKNWIQLFNVNGIVKYDFQIIKLILW